MTKTFRFHGYDGTGEIAVVVFKEMFEEFDSKIQVNYYMRKNILPDNKIKVTQIVEWHIFSETDEQLLDTY